MGRNIAKNFNCLSRVHEHYRETTDGRMGDDIAKKGNTVGAHKHCQQTVMLR